MKKVALVRGNLLCITFTISTQFDKMCNALPNEQTFFFKYFVECSNEIVF